MENNINKQDETLDSGLNNEAIKPETTIQSSASTVSSNESVSSTYETNSEFDSSSNKRVKSGSYNATLLLAYFLGTFGIHRFINNKVVSGIMMIVLSFFSSIPFVVYVIVAADSLDKGEGSAWLIAFILFAIMLIVPIWRFVDVIVIMAGKFKNKKTGEYVTSGKPFIQTWSNVVVLVLIILSMILTPIVTFATGWFSLEPTVVEEEDEDEGDGEEEELNIKDAMEEAYEEFLDNASDNGYSVYMYGEEDGFSAEYEINYFPDGTYDFYISFDDEEMYLVCGVDGEYDISDSLLEEYDEYTEDDIKDMCGDSDFDGDVESTIEDLIDIDMGDLFDLDEDEYEEEKKYYAAEVEGADYDYEITVYKDGETLEAVSDYITFTVEVM